jgi:RNA polymerase sigma factor (sigma-70 family)
MCPRTSYEGERGGEEPELDDPRWASLYAVSRPRLYRAAAFLVGADEAEEVVQDAFERAIRDRDFFTTVREPEAWLRTAVVRLAVSRLRRRQVWQRIRAALVPEPPHADVRVDLRRAIDRLGPTQRGAIVLRYYFDASHAEIAQAIGVSEASVGRILARAKETLRRDLA